MKLTKGTILAHKRKRAGIEQAALAAALGISASALCKMEKGQREHDWTRFDTAHEMIERLERGEPVPVRDDSLKVNPAWKDATHDIEFGKLQPSGPVPVREEASDE